MTSPDQLSETDKFLARIKLTFPGKKWNETVGEIIDDQTQVKSSMVEKIGYSHDYSALAVRYHRGGNWLYLGVPEAVYEALVASPSIGKAIISLLKGKYEELRLDA